MWAEAQTKPNPRFIDYPASQFFKGRPKKIVWPKGFDQANPNNEKLISTIGLTLPHNPNFAGHFAIVQNSCGTNCSEATIINMKSGQVLDDFPYGTLETSLDSKDGPAYKGLSFRLQSRLLIASGCFDWDAPDSAHQCGTKYFDFKNNHFVLIKYVSGSSLGE